MFLFAVYNFSILVYCSIVYYNALYHRIWKIDDDNADKNKVKRDIRYLQYTHFPC